MMKLKNNYTKEVNIIIKTKITGQKNDLVQQKLCATQGRYILFSQNFKYVKVYPFCLF